MAAGDTSDTYYLGLQYSVAPLVNVNPLENGDAVPQNAHAQRYRLSYMYEILNAKPEIRAGPRGPPWAYVQNFLR